MDVLVRGQRSHSPATDAVGSAAPAPRPPSQTVSVEYAASALGVGRTTVYNAIKRGELPVLRIGRRVVVRRATLDRLLADPDALPQLLLDDPDTATP